MADLKRSLTLTQLVFYGVGTMVGAGIYSIIGAAAGEAGAYLWISFLFAGLVAFLTVLSYAELASMMTKADAEYQFMKKAFPKWRLLSFMAGYGSRLNSAYAPEARTRQSPRRFRMTSPAFLKPAET